MSEPLGRSRCLDFIIELTIVVVVVVVVVVVDVVVAVDVAAVAVIDIAGRYRWPLMRLS